MLAENPDHPWSHSNLAETLDELERFEDAGRHFERAIELDPADPEGYFALTGVRERQGKIPEAAAVLRAALAPLPAPGPGTPAPPP